MPPTELAGAMRTVVVWGRPNDDDVIETFHTRRLEIVGLPELQNHAKDLYDWLTTAGNLWRLLKSNTFKLKRVIVYDLQPGSAMAGEYAGETVGGSTQPPTAHQVAGVITWLTQFRGAQYRGRTYVGPLSMNWITTTGYINTTGLDALMAGGAALMAQLTVMGTPMVVASFTRPGVENVVGLQVDNSPDVQRRRQLRATERRTEFAVL